MEICEYIDILKRKHPAAYNAILFEKSRLILKKQYKFDHDKFLPLRICKRSNSESGNIMVVYIIEAKYITRGVVIVVRVLSPNQIVTLEVL